jgi:hypothetical protein
MLQIKTGTETPLVAHPPGFKLTKIKRNISKRINILLKGLEKPI